MTRRPPWPPSTRSTTPGSARTRGVQARSRRPRVVVTHVKGAVPKHVLFLLTSPPSHFWRCELLRGAKEEGVSERARVCVCACVLGGGGKKCLA